jgi:hypothetical protein
MSIVSGDVYVTSHIAFACRSSSSILLHVFATTIWSVTYSVSLSRSGGLTAREVVEGLTVQSTMITRVVVWIRFLSMSTRDSNNRSITYSSLLTAID